MMFGCVVTEYYYNSFYAPSVRSSIVYLKQAFDQKDLSVVLYFCKEENIEMLYRVFFRLTINLIR